MGINDHKSHVQVPNQCADPARVEVVVAAPFCRRRMSQMPCTVAELLLTSTVDARSSFPKCQIPLQGGFSFVGRGRKLPVSSCHAFQCLPMSHVRRDQCRFVSVLLMLKGLSPSTPLLLRSVAREAGRVLHPVAQLSLLLPYVPALSFSLVLLFCPVALCCLLFPSLLCNLLFFSSQGSRRVSIILLAARSMGKG